MREVSLAIVVLLLASGAAGLGQRVKGESAGAAAQLAAAPTAPMGFGAVFTRASYAGPETSYNTVAVEDSDLDMLLSTNVQCIRMDIGFAPWLDNNQTAVGEVTTLVHTLEAAGKCLIIADAASETYRNGGCLDWTAFQTAWVQRVSTLAALYQPSYYIVIKEPGWYSPMVCDSGTNPSFSSADDWLNLTQQLVAAVHSVSPSTEVGVSFSAGALYGGASLSFSTEFDQGLQSMSGISFVGYDVYGSSDEAATQTFLSENPSSKPIWIAETWSTTDGSTLNNDPDDDAQWMQSIYSFALSINASFLIPFFTDDFASYTLTANPPPTTTSQILDLYQQRTPAFSAFQGVVADADPSSSSSTSSTSTSTSSTSTSSSSSSTASSSTTSSVSSSHSSTLVTFGDLETSSSAVTNTSSTASVGSSPFTFALSLAPDLGTVAAGAGTMTAASVVLLTGSPHPVGLSASGLPSGVSVSFSPVAGTASFVSAMVVNSSRTTAPGTYGFTVVGRSGTQTSSARFELTVLAAGVQAPALFISISSEEGGATDPPTGAYTSPAGQLFNVTAIPANGWSFDHWEVDDAFAGNGTTLSFVPGANASIIAVFSQAVASTTPTSSISFSARGVESSTLLVDGDPYSLPASFSWPVGSYHEVSIPGILPEGTGTELALASWGGAKSSSPTLNFTVKGNAGFVAEYRTEYLVDFAFVDSSGAPVAPQSATISGPAGWATLTQANSSAWLVSGGSYSLVGVLVKGVVVPQLPGFGSFTPDSPGSITFPLSIFPVSIRAVDILGQPISGVNVTLSEAGAQSSRLTGANGTVTFDAVPNGWFAATYRYLGVSGSLSSAATGPHSDTVTLLLSYPVLLVGGIFLAVLALARAQAWRRGRGGGNDNPFA